MTSEKTARIRALNDRARQTPNEALLLLTAGVLEAGLHFQREALKMLATFDTFSPGDDPYHEHDFGAFIVDSRRLYFKIDYYADRTLTRGADDPSDATRCVRVITLMLAEEY